MKFKQLVLVLLLGAPQIVANAQTFTDLDAMYEQYGARPAAPMIQGLDGNLYGTTTEGGNYNGNCDFDGCGVIFKLGFDGTLTTLYSFYPRSQGYDSEAGLTPLANAAFYGTTCLGGVKGNYGTVFAFTPNGVLTTVHSFDQTDGSCPMGTLILGVDGDFYGTTSGGGSANLGTVFKITPTGQVTTLHSFVGIDGSGPKSGLIVGADGSFYGTTPTGGWNDVGTIFAITRGGDFRSIYSFDTTYGASPQAALLLATDGNYYGTTNAGGSGGAGTVYKLGSGRVFTTLCTFMGNPGQGPAAPLIEGTDGNFYGTTAGVPHFGNLFEVTPDGVLTILYTLNNLEGDGSDPVAALVQATNGIFYGSTNQLGAGNGGELFSLATGLGPFVRALRNIGSTGSTVQILGTNLTGTTGVSFNGVAAKFMLVSPSEISATVPAGAVTGKIVVDTPGGTLTSNVPFVIR